MRPLLGMCAMHLPRKLRPAALGAVHSVSTLQIQGEVGGIRGETDSLATVTNPLKPNHCVNLK